MKEMRTSCHAALVGSVAALVLGTASAAIADGQNPNAPEVTTTAGGDSFTAVGNWRGRGGPGDSGAVPADGTRQASTQPPPTQWRLACAGNVPRANPLAEAFCPQAVKACAGTPDPADVLYWRFTLTAQPGSDKNGRVNGKTVPLWVTSGRACLRPDQVPKVGAPTPVLTLRDFQRLPLPPGTAHVQPAVGWALINVETNVYVDARPVVLTTTLLGQPVQVKATPVRFRWTFGEGQPLTTTDAGGPYPRMTTTHTYDRPGTYSIGLTTFYAGEYSVAGGPWLPVDGQAFVASPAIPIELVEARSHLVAGTTD